MRANDRTVATILTENSLVSVLSVHNHDAHRHAARSPNTANRLYLVFRLLAAFGFALAFISTSQIVLLIRPTALGASQRTSTALLTNLDPLPMPRFNSSTVNIGIIATLGLGVFAISASNAQARHQFQSIMHDL